MKSIRFVGTAMLAVGLVLATGTAAPASAAFAAPTTAAFAKHVTDMPERVGPATTPAPSAVGAGGGSTCRPGTPATAPPTTDFYDPARPALGPRVLPDAPPVGPLLVGYHRLGHLTEGQFVDRYRTGSSWIYPPDDGFLTVAGVPLRYRQTLRPGAEIDRFGYSGGGYLSPAHTPFARRALPPQNLTTPADSPLSNYHLYCVLRPFAVRAGPIAPWFEQPGLGLQYELDPAYLPAAGTALTVTWLLTHGYLVEEDPAVTG